MTPEQFPKIDLFPRLTKAAEFVKSLVHFLPDTPLSRGDHVGNTGAAAMLDQELYDGGVQPNVQ